jgi:hypothetical protein
MSISEKPGAGFQSLLNGTAYLAFILLLGAFFYHSLTYFGHIFTDRPGSDRNFGQDLSSAIVEVALAVAVTIIIVYLLPRGKGQKDDDNITPEKEPSQDK